MEDFRINYSRALQCEAPDFFHPSAWRANRIFARIAEPELVVVDVDVADPTGRFRPDDQAHASPELIKSDGDVSCLEAGSEMSLYCFEQCTCLHNMLYKQYKLR